MKTIRIFVLMLSSLLYIGASQAADKQDLIQFFESFNSLSADYSQTVMDQRMRVQRSMTGQLWVLRPGKFRWDYAQPYQQHIVADGERVWFYDVDLEQVNIKSQAETMGSTPTILLSDATELEKQFEILSVSREDQKTWFELIPKKRDSGFDALYIAMQGGVIAHMELKDSFGQLTRLDFENVRLDQPVDMSRFKLEIPDGVDVLDESQP